MFNKSIDDRLSSWADHRRLLSRSDNPLQDVWEFWKHAPYIPYNNKVDPFNQKGWPTPWEILVINQYDDFTKALMIGYTLKLSERYKDSKIEIKTLVNDQKTCYYNIVYVDDQWAINYNDNGPVIVEDIPDSFYLENLIELKGTW